MIDLQEIRDYTTDLPVILCGNKNDLASQRAVSQEQALKLAEKNGLLYMETSALDGSHVNEAFRSLVETVYKNLGLDKADFDQDTSDDEGVSAGISLSGKTIDVAEPPAEPEQKKQSSCCGIQ